MHFFEVSLSTFAMDRNSMGYHGRLGWLNIENDSRLADVGRQIISIYACVGFLKQERARSLVGIQQLEKGLDDLTKRFWLEGGEPRLMSRCRIWGDEIAKRAATIDESIPPPNEPKPKRRRVELPLPEQSNSSGSNRLTNAIHASQKAKGPPALLPVSDAPVLPTDDEL